MDISKFEPYDLLVRTKPCTAMNIKEMKQEAIVFGELVEFFGVAAETIYLKRLGDKDGNWLLVPVDPFIDGWELFNEASQIQYENELLDEGVCDDEGFEDTVIEEIAAAIEENNFEKLKKIKNIFDSLTKNI